MRADKTALSDLARLYLSLVNLAVDVTLVDRARPK